jgi:Domain of unknown function (DUF6471)
MVKREIDASAESRAKADREVQQQTEQAAAEKVTLEEQQETKEAAQENADPEAAEKAKQKAQKKANRDALLIAQKSARRQLKRMLGGQDLQYKELVDLLERNVKVYETERSIQGKIVRGSFSAAFLLQCMQAVGVKRIDIDE